jgi:hypothetical protein
MREMKKDIEAIVNKHQLVDCFEQGKKQKDYAMRYRKGYFREFEKEDNDNIADSLQELQK